MGFVERKIGCAKEFAKLLVGRLRGRLIKVALFGSVAKGLCDADSDVDVLIIVDRVDEEVKHIVAESAFEVSVKFQEPIEYIVMELEEYRMKGLKTHLYTRLSATARHCTTIRSLRRRGLRSC